MAFRRVSASHTLHALLINYGSGLVRDALLWVFVRAVSKACLDWTSRLATTVVAIHRTRSCSYIVLRKRRWTLKSGIPVSFHTRTWF